MTIRQTRQLGIEFERRLQTIDQTRVIIRKIDSDDIYSYLNMYQEQYIRQLNAADQQIESNTKQASIIQDLLRTLIKRHNCLPVGQLSQCITYDIPEDYWLYQRAYASVVGTYKNIKVSTPVPCVQLKQVDVNVVEDMLFDKDRIIRTPIVDIASTKSSADTFNLYYDRYTTVNSITLVYIRKPQTFSILTNTPCELPMSCFNDLVEGAVQMYIADNYKLSGINNKPNKKEDDKQ